MLKDVEFLAWGPHDPKGETVNVMKADRYLVVRVRYRYQRAGEPAVEKDELYKLERGVPVQEAPDQVVPQTVITGFNIRDVDFGRNGLANGFGPAANNPDGGAWLGKALGAKRERERR
jgi:hypothetical protein